MTIIDDMTTETTRDGSASEVLDAIERLSTDIRARAAEFEDVRRIPEDLITELKRHRVFDILTPREYNGLQMGVRESVRVIEAIATLDGSLGWATMIGVESPQILALLPVAAYDRLFRAADRPLFGGTFLPSGTARRVDGGYRVSGRWGFASGCQNWDLLFGNCVVLDEAGERVPGRMPGTPLTRAMVMPSGAVTIEDTWRTLGLRGSGSHHFHCEDVFVAEDMSFDILHDRPNVAGVGRLPIAEFNTHIVAVILGIAQGAMNDFADVAAEKKRMGQVVSASRNPVVQFRIGHAQAQLRAARAYLYSVAGELETVTGDEHPDLVADLTGPMNAWVTEACVEIVDLVWSLSGAASAFDGSVFQRRLRDISVARQHAAVTDAAFTKAGAKLFGEVVESVQQTQAAGSAR
ncbi:flavin-dependent monooxygenase [Okibacterium endophyticum]